MLRLQQVGQRRSLRSVVACEVLMTEVLMTVIAVPAPSGGHLGPNLGTVELTMALHRVFRSPRDVLLFDTGHQAYVHKLLTGPQVADPGHRLAQRRHRRHHPRLTDRPPRPRSQSRPAHPRIPRAAATPPRDRLLPPCGRAQVDVLTLGRARAPQPAMSP